MPEFVPGTIKTATIPITNPTLAAFNFRTVLFMGVNQMAMAEETQLIGPESTEDIELQVTMPTEVGEYPVYVAVYANSELLRLQQSIENVTIANQYIIDFTNFWVSPVTVQVSTGWWGTSYYAVWWHSISWNASQRIPAAEGMGSADIVVTVSLSGHGYSWEGSYITTPQTRDSQSAYYFPVGSGSVGQPYAGMNLSFGETRPPAGDYNYAALIQARHQGEIYGQNSFSGIIELT